LRGGANFEDLMPIYRLLTAAAALALVAGTADAQTPAKAAAKTEAQAKAVTGKASTDAPANTAVQGTAKAVKEGAAPAVQAAPSAAVNTQATAAAPAAGEIKPVTVQGDLIDTLRLSGQFNTFLKGVDSTNLTGLLKTNKNLTVFAPTDAAFAAMPPAELAHLQSDKAAMQKFILHHVVNAPIDSTKIKGHAGPVPSGAGDNVMLDGSDEAGTLKVDGATIVQADLHTGSGLLQVVDKVLTPGTPAPAASAAAASSGTAAPASATAPAPK
jgi:uncharacterized surface protein with fasciclin (FAS1) repeats